MNGLRVRTRSIDRAICRAATTVTAAAIGILVFAMVAAGVAGNWQWEERNFGFSLANHFDELFEIEMGIPDDDEIEPAPVREWNLDWIDTVARIIVAAAAAYVAWRLLRRVKIHRKVRRRPGEASDAQLIDVPEPPLHHVQQEMRDGVDVALAQLDGAATPTDAIIAAWLALEQAADAAGYPRRPSHTPTEFTLILLGRLAVNAPAARRLLDRYHLARFGHVQLGDAERAATRHDLAILATDLHQERVDPLLSDTTQPGSRA